MSGLSADKKTGSNKSSLDKIQGVLQTAEKQIAVLYFPEQENPKLETQALGAYGKCLSLKQHIQATTDSNYVLQLQRVLDKYKPLYSYLRAKNPDIRQRNDFTDLKTLAEDNNPFAQNLLGLAIIEKHFATGQMAFASYTNLLNKSLDVLKRSAKNGALAALKNIFYIHERQGDKSAELTHKALAYLGGNGVVYAELAPMASLFYGIVSNKAEKYYYTKIIEKCGFYAVNQQARELFDNEIIVSRHNAAIEALRAALQGDTSATFERETISGTAATFHLPTEYSSSETIKHKDFLKNPYSQFGNALDSIYVKPFESSQSTTSDPEILSRMSDLEQEVDKLKTEVGTVKTSLTRVKAKLTVVGNNNLRLAKQNSVLRHRHSDTVNNTASVRQFPGSGESQSIRDSAPQPATFASMGGTPLELASHNHTPRFRSGG